MAGSEVLNLNPAENRSASNVRFWVQTPNPAKNRSASNLKFSDWQKHEEKTSFLHRKIVKISFLDTCGNYFGSELLPKVLSENVGRELMPKIKFERILSVQNIHFRLGIDLGLSEGKCKGMSSEKIRIFFNDWKRSASIFDLEFPWGYQKKIIKELQAKKLIA